MSTIEYLFAVATVYAVAVTILLVVSRRQISWLRMDIEQEQVWVQEFRDQAKKWQQHCCQRKAEIAAILEKL